MIVVLVGRREERSTRGDKNVSVPANTARQLPAGMLGGCTALSKMSAC